MKSRLVTITVSEEDVREGQARSCSHCPVALAIQRQLKPGFTPQVGPQDWQIYEGANLQIRDMHISHALVFGKFPATVTDFILGFDRGGRDAAWAYLPSPFQLEIPTHALLEAV